jgi:hypothetical protein
MTNEEMRENVENPTTTPASNLPPAKRVIGRPFPKGVSGNPSGRPRLEARIRRYARKYDRRLVDELWKLGTDPKVPADVRRRTLMDLQAIGSGRPPTTQELVGRPDAPLGPLVSLTFQGQQPSALTPAQAYELMVRGTLEADPQHEAFQRRPAIEAQPGTVAEPTEGTP